MGQEQMTPESWRYSVNKLKYSEKYQQGYILKFNGIGDMLGCILELQSVINEIFQKLCDFYLMHNFDEYH